MEEEDDNMFETAIYVIVAVVITGVVVYFYISNKMQKIINGDSTACAGNIAEKEATMAGIISGAQQLKDELNIQISAKQKLIDQLSKSVEDNVNMYNNLETKYGELVNNTALSAANAELLISQLKNELVSARMLRIVELGNVLQISRNGTVVTSKKYPDKCMDSSNNTVSMGVCNNSIDQSYLPVMQRFIKMVPDLNKISDPKCVSGSSGKLTVQSCDKIDAASPQGIFFNTGDQIVVDAGKCLEATDSGEIKLAECDTSILSQKFSTRTGTPI